MLAVQILGFVLGVLYSQWIEGHRPSQAGWFDLRSLDPVMFFVQDAIYGLIGFAIASFLFMGVSACVAAVQTVQTGAKPLLAGSFTSLVLLGGFTYCYAQDYYAKAARQEEARKEGIKYDKQMAEYNKQIGYQWATLGWVKYPHLHTEDVECPGGWKQAGSFSIFKPTDDFQTVSDYYLTKAESWERSGKNYMVMVKNDWAWFRVEVGSDDRCYVFLEQPGKALANKGPGKFDSQEAETPLASHAPVDAQQANSTPASFAAGSKLIYPGSVSEVQDGKLRMSTHDNVDKVRDYYLAMGASPTSELQTSNQSKLKLTFQDVTYDVSAVHAWMKSGEQFTLIEIQP